MRLKEITSSALRWLAGVRHGKPITILKTMIPMRGVAILFVVVAHAAIINLAAENNLAPGTRISPDILGFWQISSLWKSILHELSSCAVPIFLFLSGYYALSSPQTWKCVWSNSKKLLLPMATWSLAAWAFTWRKGSGGWAVAEFLERLISGRTQTGYFFIILITQFYILSKWLVPAMKRRPGHILALAALIQLIPQAYDYVFLLSELELIKPIGWVLKAGPFPEQLFPRFMFSFSLGIWAGCASRDFRSIITDRFRLVVPVAIIAAMILIIERGAIFRHAFMVIDKTEFEATSVSWVGWKLSTALWTISAIFLFFGWFQRRIPMKSFFDWLGKYSFQIFILHGMVLDILRSALYKYCAGARFYEVWGFVLLMVAGILVPIGLTRIIQKRAPTTLRMLLLGQ